VDMFGKECCKEWGEWEQGRSGPGREVPSKEVESSVKYNNN